MGEQIEFNVSFREPPLNRKPENLLPPPLQPGVYFNADALNFNSPRPPPPRISIFNLARIYSTKYITSGNHNNRPIDLFSNTTATRSFRFRSFLSLSLFSYVSRPKRYPLPETISLSCLYGSRYAARKRREIRFTLSVIKCRENIHANRLSTIKKRNCSPVGQV